MADSRRPGAGNNILMGRWLNRGFGTHGGVGSGVGTGGMDTGTNGPVTPPPIDHPDVEVHQHSLLLREASLARFEAIPAQLPPYGRCKVKWAINMPTTVIPGVHVEAHMWNEEFDQVIEPSGEVEVFPYANTTYSIYLRTQRVAHELGKLELDVNFETCWSDEAVRIDKFKEKIIEEAKKQFPTDDELTFRGEPSVEIGYNAITVEFPLEAHVENWFNANIDVSMGFTISSHEGTIRVRSGHNIVKVSFGVLSSAFSLGCTAVVAIALEKQAEGFLRTFIGPEIARRITRPLTELMEERRAAINSSSDVPHRPLNFYDIQLTDDALRFRFCPPVRSNNDGGVFEPHPL